MCVGPLRKEELTETTFQKFHVFADVELQILYAVSSQRQGCSVELLLSGIISIQLV